MTLRRPLPLTISAPPSSLITWAKCAVSGDGLIGGSSGSRRSRTLLAADLALVTQLDRRLDPVDASILDYNAQLLSKTKVDGRPLRVERIWIPPRRGENWSPFTNIILTDGLVLIPTYNHDLPQYVNAAVQAYKRLLPNHQVTTVDMTSMEKLRGSLHCLFCPIPSFAELPKDTMSFEQVIALANKSPVK